MKFSKVMWITLGWTFVGILDALNTHAITKAGYIHLVENYNFVHYFLVNTLSAFFAGLVSGTILIFFLREWVRAKSFGFALVVNSMVIAILNLLISVLAFSLSSSIYLKEMLWHPAVMENTALVVGPAFYLKYFILWGLVVFLTITFLHVDDKYGTGVLVKLLLGRYYRPREEERIFMFVDIRSSTTIAERLGHIRFFNLLNDFYRDITNPIINASGEMYQYVGDEVVIAWTMEEGLTNANCIRCFYNMQEALNRLAHRYQDRYGLIPQFKAGLHCGMVTIGEIGVIKKDIVYSGDVMNTTSRIQNSCNKYGVDILLSKYLLDKLNRPPHDFYPHRVGIIELKGKKQKIELFTLGEEESHHDQRFEVLST
ncbi:MAG: hypothetical protein DHS20C18_43920 [Saprospiraceae bacterium]|nr:MAG: hypothetical protein DHS20C18_43920 [Saprospiraceae bacterium]